MRILFTGASSFTGFWFVKALAAEGHAIICPLTADKDRYAGVRKRRVEELELSCRFVPNAPFGSEAFLELTKDGHWDLFCHHGAASASSEAGEFSPLRAAEQNTHNVTAVLNELGERGLRAVVLTGSVAENDEGIGNAPLAAFSPCALSKALTFQVFRYYCTTAGVALAKFVVPHPFGPYEDSGLIASLISAWRDGQVFTVKTPEYIRDHIPVDMLSRVYRNFASVAGRPPFVSAIHPSCYVENVETFCRRVAREVQARRPWQCALDVPPQETFDEPFMRVNSDPALGMVGDWDESAFWDSLVDFYDPAGKKA